MAEREAPTAAYARSILDYNPETGALRWKTRGPGTFRSTAVRTTHHKCAQWNSRFSGSIAGCKDAHGYIVVSINGLKFKGQDLAWLLWFGRWPASRLDHKNLHRSDNRINNLREADNSQNCCNRGASKRSSSGIKGVFPLKGSKRYRVRISLRGVDRHVGYFGTKEEAAVAYAKAAKEIHGEFARTE